MFGNMSVCSLTQLWNLWVGSITRIFLRKMWISGNSRSWFSMLTPKVLRLSLSWISCVCVLCWSFCWGLQQQHCRFWYRWSHGYSFLLDWFYSGSLWVDGYYVYDFVREKNWRKSTSLFWEVCFQYLKNVRAIGISKKILFQVENFDFYRRGFSLGRAEQLHLL